MEKKEKNEKLQEQKEVLTEKERLLREIEAQKKIIEMFEDETWNSEESKEVRVKEALKTFLEQLSAGTLANIAFEYWQMNRDLKNELRKLYEDGALPF